MIGSYDFRDKLICFDKEDIKVGEKYFTVDMRIRASGSFFIDTEYAERFVEIEDFYIEEVSPIYSDEEEIFSKYNLSELEEALEDDNKFLKKVENKCYDEIFHY